MFLAQVPSMFDLRLGKPIDSERAELAVARLTAIQDRLAPIAVGEAVLSSLSSNGDLVASLEERAVWQLQGFCSFGQVVLVEGLAHFALCHVSSLSAPGIGALWRRQ